MNNMRAAPGAPDGLPLAGLLEETLPASTKGLRFSFAGRPLRDIGTQGWNVLHGDVPLPAAVLKDSALIHNSRTMQKFSQHVGFKLAPHGKTTMAPQLFDRQLRDGAWGMTAATVGHVVTYRRFGVRRILFANQLIDPLGIEFVLDELARDPEFEFYCLVDSRASIDRLADAVARRQHARPIQVLIEVGATGGRSGVRTLAAAVALARHLRANLSSLELRGVALFEGIYGVPTGPTAAQKVSTLIVNARAIIDRIMALGLFAPGPILVTAGGSAFFEQVAFELGRAGGPEFVFVLRSGCYLTYDHGMYEQMLSKSARVPMWAVSLPQPLRPALEVWGYIQSRPEPQLAIANFGKRDLSYDLGLPRPLSWRRPALTAHLQSFDESVSVSALNDQHAYLQIPADHALAVGDLVGVGVSHTCTTFDKWQPLYLVDDDYNVIGGIRTFF